jgi:hypothetical protein
VIETIPVVGKIPPLTRVWLKHLPATVMTLQTRPPVADDPDFAQVLVIRARHLFRNQVVHSEREPLAAEAHDVVERFVRMTDLVLSSKDASRFGFLESPVKVRFSAPALAPRHGARAAHRKTRAEYVEPLSVPEGSHRLEYHHPEATQGRLDASSSFLRGAS